MRGAVFVAIVLAGCGTRTDPFDLYDDVDVGTATEGASGPTACNSVAIDDAPLVPVTFVDATLAEPKGGGTLHDGRWVLVRFRYHGGSDHIPPPFTSAREAFVVHGGQLDDASTLDGRPIVRTSSTWSIQHGSGRPSLHLDLVCGPLPPPMMGTFAATDSTMTLWLPDIDFGVELEWTYARR